MTKSKQCPCKPSKYVIRNVLSFQNEHSELLDCQNVSVIEFLEYLFGTAFWSEAGEEAETAFEDAYIKFSHWISMEEFISPPDANDVEDGTAEELAR